MLRETRRRLRRLRRLFTPATLFGLAGLPGLANAVADRLASALPVARPNNNFINWRRCMCGTLLLRIE